MRLWSFTLLSALLAVACGGPAPQTELHHESKYLAVFSSPALTTPDDDRRLAAAFQSKYRSRVILLRPVTGQAYLKELGVKASLFAMVKINSLRETRVVVKEIEQALGNATLAALLPLAETAGSQDNFSGLIFQLALEKRASGFNRLNSRAKADIFRLEAEEFSHDRNLLSYFASISLNDTPYQTVRLLGFSGVMETQYETYDGLYTRTVRKLDGADTAIVEKVR
jgi:hypothetical protein